MKITHADRYGLELTIEQCVDKHEAWIILCFGERYERGIVMSPDDKTLWALICLLRYKRAKLSGHDAILRNDHTGGYMLHRQRKGPSLSIGHFCQVKPFILTYSFNDAKLAQIADDIEKLWESLPDIVPPEALPMGCQPRQMLVADLF